MALAMGAMTTGAALTLFSGSMRLGADTLGATGMLRREGTGGGARMARRAALARSAGAPTLDAPNAPGALASGGQAAGTAAQSPALTRFVLPGAIRVVDAERREIEVCATSE